MDEEMKTLDVQNLFGVTPMTVYNWRTKGDENKRIPHHTTVRGTRNGVVFKRSEVLAWAASNRIKLANGVVPVLPRARAQIAVGSR